MTFGHILGDKLEVKFADKIPSKIKITLPEGIINIALGFATKEVIDFIGSHAYKVYNNYLNQPSQTVDDASLSGDNGLSLYGNFLGLINL